MSVTHLSLNSFYQKKSKFKNRYFLAKLSFSIEINTIFLNSMLELNKQCTVKVMIMSRYRYRPVTVLGPTLPTVTVFGPTLPIVTQRDINVTNRYRILPLLALQALQALPIVI
jgi:hypothetical protein